MAWIEAHQELARHPKLRKAAKALNIPQPQLIGHLFMLWWWALDYAPDGTIHDLDDAADALNLEPTTDPTLFVTTLIAHGFLDANGDTWVIHDWNDYGGKTVAARDASKESGAYGNHVRWHLQAPRAGCQWCRTENGANKPFIAPRSGGESGGESGGDSGGSSGGESGASRTEQNRTEQNRTAAKQADDENELSTLTRQVALERVAHMRAEGTPIKNLTALIARLEQSADIQHEARKRLTNNTPLGAHLKGINE